MVGSVPLAVQTLYFVEVVLCLTEQVSCEVVGMAEGSDPY